MAKQSKITKSSIMRTANRYRKSLGYSKSKALKAAWRDARAAKRIATKEKE